MTLPDRFCVLKESRNDGVWLLFKYEKDRAHSYWLYCGAAEGSKEELELKMAATGTPVTTKCTEGFLNVCMSAAEILQNMEFG